MRSRLSAEALLKTGWRTTRQVFHLARRLPQRLERSPVCRRGPRTGGVDAGYRSPCPPTVGTDVARAIRGAMVCALIIGGSLLIQAHIGPMVKGLSIAGLLGYGLAWRLVFPSAHAEASRWGLVRLVLRTEDSGLSPVRPRSVPSPSSVLFHGNSPRTRSP